MNSASRALMMASMREGERLAREAERIGNYEEAHRILGLLNDPRGYRTIQSIEYNDKFVLGEE